MNEEERLQQFMKELEQAGKRYGVGLEVKLELVNLGDLGQVIRPQLKALLFEDWDPSMLEAY